MNTSPALSSGSSAPAAPSGFRPGFYPLLILPLLVHQRKHIAFTCSEILSLVDIQKSPDPEGMKVFHYLVQDLRCLIFTLINLHFKVKPIPT